ncbi:MAG: hypothetical protein B6226_03205 [Candidatus Cloacimonetes bacterium 4572_65]|nr:MAG: hypothetical protein B6226_03205 [Candidatus Cloacimonetes bacterium 4572_65]
MKIVKIVSIFFILFSLMSLTATENKKLTLVTCEWAPFYSSQLENQGFFSEIVRESFKNVDYDVDFTFTDWDVAMDLAAKNSYNGLHGAYYSEERELLFNYSYPIYSVKTVFLAKRELNLNYDSNLENLRNRRIGISKGYAYTDEFDNSELFVKVEAGGPKQLLDLLFADEVDVIVVQADVAQQIIIKKYITRVGEIEALGPSLTENKLYVAISREYPNHKMVVNDFNRGFEKLVNSGRYIELTKEIIKVKK